MGKIRPKQLKVREPELNALQFAERVSSEALADAQHAYDALHERVYKFATLVSGGAGAAGIYALGKLGPSANGAQVVTLGALSIWWFLIVAFVLLRGGSSRSMKAGTTGNAVRERFLAHRVTQESDNDAMWFTRWDQVAAVSKQIEEYANGTTARAHTLDHAYWCLAGSPVIAGLAYLLTLVPA